MLVRVATNDVETAKLLVVDLVGLFGGEQVSLQADGDVGVRLHGELNGALVQTLNRVECWLEQTGTASAEVCVDERSYTVEHPGRGHRSSASLKSNGSTSPRARVAVNGWEDSRKAVGRR